MPAFSYNRGALLDRIAAFVRDAAGPSARLTVDVGGDIDVCIDAALTEFSREVPREAADPDTLATGNGTRSIPLGEIAPSWVADFSSALELEYPVDELPPTFLDKRNWTVDAACSRVLLASAITDGESVRLRYTVRHAVEGFADGTATTISAALWPAFACLCAAYACVSLQAVNTGTTDGTLGAEISNFRTKAQERSDLERKLRDRYASLLGTKQNDSSVPTFGVGFINHDLDDWTGETYFHRRPGAD